MSYLLMAATAAEIGPFLDYYHQSGKADLDILITGVGLPAATYSLTRQIELKRPGLVIQAGIAGSFDHKMALGSVVCIRKDAFADQGVIETGNLHSVFDLGLADPDRLPYKKGWLVNPGNSMIRSSGLKMVDGITINQISTSTEMINLYKTKYKPVIESMEGAALHYVCLMEKIPFLQLRSVSNYIGERNKQKWKIKEAIKNLNLELIRLLKKV